MKVVVLALAVLFVAAITTATDDFALTTIDIDGKYKSPKLKAWIAQSVLPKLTRGGWEYSDVKVTNHHISKVTLTRVNRIKSYIEMSGLMINFAGKIKVPERDAAVTFQAKAQFAPLRQFFYPGSRKVAKCKTKVNSVKAYWVDENGRKNYFIAFPKNVINNMGCKKIGNLLKFIWSITPRA